MLSDVDVEFNLKSITEHPTNFNILGERRTTRSIKKNTKSFLVHDGRLFLRTRNCLRFAPCQKTHPLILEGLHDEIGHWDFTSTYKIISERFW